MSRVSPRSFLLSIATLGAVVAFGASTIGQGQQGAGQQPPPAGAGAGAGRGQATGQPPGQGRGQTPEQIQAQLDRQLQQQVQTDATWRAASEGVMRMDKITYTSRAGGLSIPAFVFQPLTLRGPKGHPALVWVHPDIRGHVYEYYIPYVREAVKRGYVVIAPEYRGSVGYGKEFYDAIDYGGAEVDDVLTAVDYLKTLPHVDMARVGIIGWSHGGMITLLSITREASTFKAAVAMVPVTNLFQRLAWAGVERQHQAIDPANRYGGLPNERHDIYRERSPIYQIDKLQIPLLVHITRNDGDVHIEECMQLVDALRARKPFLSETKVYDEPLGGHLFDRQYDRNDTKTYTPLNTREQRDSWNRVWTFLDWNLDPYSVK
jgi:dipeptidyl aminopeptidase/acylaminoacyl peptidase